MTSSPLHGRLCIIIAVVILLFMPLTFSGKNNAALAQFSEDPQQVIDGYGLCQALNSYIHTFDVSAIGLTPAPPLECDIEYSPPPEPLNPLDCNELNTCPTDQCGVLPTSLNLHDSYGQSKILFVDYVYVQDNICVPCPNPKKISAELRDAVNFPPIKTQSSMSPEERAVLTWLRVHLEEIIQAETKWNIDRRAIAGAIAWEALYNAKDPPGFFNRWSGPGKVHNWDVKTVPNPYQVPGLEPTLPFTIEPDTTAAQDAENAGYLPKVSNEERGKILSTPEGAINYIGAIMRSQADALLAAGYDISRDPALLTFYYQSRDLDQVQQRANELSQQGSPPDALSDISGSEMAKWAKTHLDYLEEAVGRPDSSPPQDYFTSPKAEKCIPLQ